MTVVEEELVRNRMEVTGEEVATCDLCGFAYARSALQLVDPLVFAPDAEPTGGWLWVCPDCLRKIEEGDIDLDIAEAEELG